MPGGRPSKLTPETEEKIFNSVRLGCPVLKSCEYAGINKDTYYEWIKRGKAEKTGVYKEFSDKLKEIEAEATLRLLKQIQEDSSWQSKAWILERRFKHDWGRDAPDAEGRNVNININYKKPGTKNEIK